MYFFTEMTSDTCRLVCWFFFSFLFHCISAFIFKTDNKCPENSYLWLLTPWSKKTYCCNNCDRKITERARVICESLINKSKALNWGLLQWQRWCTGQCLVEEDIGWFWILQYCQKIWQIAQYKITKYHNIWTSMPSANSMSYWNHHSVKVGDNSNISALWSEASHSHPRGHRIARKI